VDGNQLKAKKRFGQNFLTDSMIINEIINSFYATENDLIIEIGPGRGALTKYLKKYHAMMILYEIDTDLKQYLDGFIDDKTKVIYRDFLLSNIANDIANLSYNHLFIVGNLPYYITTPILEHIINEKIKFESLTIMIQKEVAERFMALPGNKEYGYFSLFLQYYFDIYKIVDVDKHSFNPVPKVDSMVIKLVPNKKKVSDEAKYFKFLKQSFSQKRKTLKNNLGSECFNRVLPILKENGFNESVRAEEIPEALFFQIYNI
jgi:16S rRNA (adenine1518-N6/adenine1519-N6)-dimethyltransferase